ncbi:hypothetical protein ILUMI_17343 [Ignelater luminosus]|uniref:Uncharacterized protein n=1 Tax=Ignelater luminosus TaxID=2038154 RepID=A0A8K0CKA6_IGNLU|nr:hypothetical protein ILUMI_17343 [Ignelater luminosus]
MSVICKEGAIIGSGIARSDSQLNVNIMFAEVHSKTLNDVKSYLKTKYTRATVFYSLIEWYKGNVWQDDSGGPFICYDSYTPIQHGVISSRIPIKDNIVLMEYESLSKHMWFINTLVPSLQTKKRFRRSGQKNETDAANPSANTEKESGDDSTPGTQHFLFSVRVKPSFVLYFTFLFYLLCK